jgi:hypothetical protein
MEALWPIVTVLGPLLLLAALIWGFMRNRGQSAAGVQRSEDGARELREKIDREDD